MKTLDELTQEDIKKMTKEDLDVYVSKLEGDISVMRLTIQSGKERFHQLALLCKAHTVGYTRYQQEAYYLSKQNNDLKRKISSMSAAILFMRRLWETAHGTNQVDVLTRTASGKEVLIR